MIISLWKFYRNSFHSHVNRENYDQNYISQSNYSVKLQLLFCMYIFFTVCELDETKNTLQVSSAMHSVKNDRFCLPQNESVTRWSGYWDKFFVFFFFFIHPCHGRMAGELLDQTACRNESFSTKRIRVICHQNCPALLPGWHQPALPTILVRTLFPIRFYTPCIDRASRLQLILTI